MGFIIKYPHIADYVSRIAVHSGLPEEEVINLLLLEVAGGKDQISPQLQRKLKSAKSETIIDYYQSLPVLDPRTPEEISQELNS